MLAPDNRALLLDALRPPPDCSLDRAVATTFTLDLTSALTVPLAFAGFQFDEQPDPVEIMEALRRTSERLDIFCQAGAIGAGGWPSDLLALIENVVHEVRRPRPGYIFHPKVWVLRFVDQAQVPSYRTLVLSRNLTADRSWDTLLRLDGRPQRGRKRDNEPLARFVAALPNLAVTPLPPDRRSALASLAEELKRVHWDLPGGAREAHFHPIGLPGSRSFPVEEHFRGYRKLVISPFVRDQALRRVFKPTTGRKAVLVSRGEEVDALQAEVIDRVDVYELDPIASLSGDDADGDSNQAILTRLHAKLFVVERERLAHAFVGSANATDAGFDGNLEFLCELIGSVGSLGVDALVGEGAPFSRMLTPYVASDRQKTDDEGTTGRALDDLLMNIAGQVSLRTTVMERAAGWVAHVSADAQMPHIPERVRLTIAPYNRPAETWVLSPTEPIDFEFPPRDLADITPFLLLTASQTVERVMVERSVVICSQLRGALDDRFQRILARQIDTPEKFLQLLALLMGLALRSGGGIAGMRNGVAGWSAGVEEGVLELLARALSERPEAIDHLAPIVEHLRQLPNGKGILPAEWDDVWLPVLEARRAMQRVE